MPRLTAKAGRTTQFLEISLLDRSLTCVAQSVELDLLELCLGGA